MLTNQEVREMSRISELGTLRAIAADWALIGAVFAAVMKWQSPWLWVPAALLIARQQLALAILMHDGSHRRLFRSQAWNDWIGQITLAAPLLFSMDSYKKLHLKHHLDPLVADDPDLSLIGGYPISRKSFFRKVARDLFGISYFKFIRYFIYMARKSSQKSQEKSRGAASSGIPKSWVFLSILLVQAAIFGVLAAFGHPLYYLTLWLLPAMTLLQVLLRIRGIAEHAGYAPNPDQRLNARTVVNPLQAFLFAPHHVNFHIEHHLYPSVPYHRLPELHRLLKHRGVLPEANLYRGYGQILQELIR